MIAPHDHEPITPRSTDPARLPQVQLVAQGISWPALNQTVCAMRFFYGVTLGRSELPERIPYARASCR